MLEKAKQIMVERGKTKATMGDFIEAYLQISTGRTSRPEMPDGSFQEKNILLKMKGNLKESRSPFAARFH